ncbi:LysM peptidoglycan-binding domain-containing protein [Flavobacterium sp.]|jgi:membrane-bound lytic murein transglycosylase D|uniref:LysM peptidoglycan-binding domain-containing protein n=1 Tax=Flavobacterium sp. TaxID=239 RepID=UPI0037C0D0E3
MKIQNTTLALLSLVSATIFAQDTAIVTTKIAEQQPKLTYLDSIKKSFINHELATCVDDRVMKEMINQDLFNELTSDIQSIDIDQNVDYDLSTQLLKERLKILDSKSDFHIEYNKGLENIIKHYLKNRKKSYERLMGLSQYYFPVFEEKLAKYNVPLEIKYLAIVESALNPRAVSKAGATGLWQFMYGTGKQYNLDINTFVDERSDLLKSTEAACQYMVNMYAIFGDWDLVLASYNAGPGNVTKAIRRSGGKQNYWNIRPYLPKETQGYVPAFIATMYIYEFHKEHGIVPQKAVVNTYATDTILVRNKMTFKQISDLLDISVAELQFLNPSFKRDYVPFMIDKKHYLRLPLDKVAVFTSNEDKIYAYTEYDFSKREKAFAPSNEVASSDSIYYSTQTKTKYHTVRKGETLGGISNKYGVSLANLKKWNGLKSNNIALGKKLKIVSTESVAIVQKPKAIPAVPKDTLSQPKITTSDSLKQYVVVKGDNLNSISKKFDISTEELKDWNNMDNDNILVGSKLTVSSLKSTPTDSLNFNEYVVGQGDNLNTIAKKFNVSVEEIKKWNDLDSEALKYGTTLKIVKTAESETAVAQVKTQKPDKKQNYKTESIYVVKKGDSLYSISQKIPGVTVADLKKWNGISGKNIQPGMKLKING